MRSLVSGAILLVACGPSHGPPHDMSPLSKDLSGPVSLVAGPCPASLNNAHCLFLPGQDAGFY